MKFFVRGILREHPRNIFRRCGYVDEMNRRTGNISFARPGGGVYPRFHVYIDEEENGIRVNLHLDQKGACYEGHTAHSGEYDGTLVEQEAVRIQSIFRESQSR